MNCKLTIKKPLCGRWMVVLLTLLMVPVAMQAESYGLTVAGVAVTDENANNITGDGIIGGSVSYDAANKTLTLNGATLEGSVVRSSNDALTIHLVGANTINAGQGTQAFMSITSSSPQLTFTAEEGGLLRTNIPRTEGDAVICSGFSFSNEDDIPEDYMLSWDAYGHCSLGKYYGLYLYAFVNNDSHIQPYYVTEANCDRLMGKYLESNDSWDNSVITISYDDSNKMLTLNNASPISAEPYGPDFFINCDGDNVNNITVMLLGENTLRQDEVEYGAGFIKSHLNEGTVTITTDPENPGSLTMPRIGEYSEEDDVVCAYNVIYENGLAYSMDEDYVRYIKVSDSDSGYGLKVGGVTVNEHNAENVLDEVNEDEEPTVVFDPDSNTLTLNGAWITVESGDGIVSSLENLTIFLVGDNGITCYGDKVFNKSSEIDETKITFTTDEASNGSLFLSGLEENLFGSGVTPEYTNVSLKADGTDYPEISSKLGISVGGVPVTFFNTDDVFGDGTVSYDAENHVLTLNNATIETDEEKECAGIEYMNEEDLTIALIGNNSVQGSNGCAAIQKLYGVETPNLSFAQVDGQHFSLTLITESQDYFIDGFYYENGDFLVFGDEDDGTYTMTICTSVFGGTGSADEPFLIKTPEDLKRFAKYYNEGYFSRNVHVQLYNDIDCQYLEDFTAIADNSDATFCGVFDGKNNKIINLNMTGMGLFGYVGKDGDDVGTIKDLTLSGLQLNGEKRETSIGGIVAYLHAGAVVSNCTVVNSTIACESETYNPNVAAIAAHMDGATVTSCVVDNVEVKAETTYDGGSGPSGYAGGIVAYAYEGAISSCVIKNGTKITNYNADESASLYAGAIVGNAYGTTLSENYYHYDVTVEMLNGTDDTNKIIKSEYQQRGIGGTVWNEETQQYESVPDVFEDDGAVMYTQPVMLPAESEEAYVMPEEDTYYSTVVDADVFGLLVAPGQTVTLNAYPGDGYAAPSLTATNTTTEETISTESEDLGDNITQYTFEMPDAPVTVTLMTAQKMGIRVAGVEITELNADNVLGDGKVSYDAENNILTLNGATVNGCIYNYNESINSLTVHLLGENVIDGGYVSDDENGDWAFGTDVANARLYITTDEDTPGQLLIKNSYLNEWGNPEYYEGWYPQMKNGLTESQSYRDKKAFIATAPVVTPGEGLYWPDQQYEVSTRLEGAVYYQDGMGHFSQKTYEAPFTMPTAGNYNLSVWEKVTVDDTDFSLYASGSLYIVHNKPGFSVEEGTYNEEQTIKLTNLPTLPQNSSYYPQVWYYLNDNKNDSIQYTSAEQEIALTESAKVCVYILDEDSGKVVKSAPVEAEYTIVAMTQLNISYAENSREWASYCADENLETPDGLQAYVVTEATAEGVSVAEIDYIPQGVGVLLKRTKNIAEPIMAKAYMGVEPEAPDNLLKGAAESTAVSSETGNVYVLYNDGFTRATKGTIPAHRAYLVLNDNAESRLSILEDNDATSLTLVNNEKKIVNSDVYDLQGRKVNHSSLFTSGKATLKKGLYILNGQKQVIK